MWLVADGNNRWLRIGDAAGVKLFTADAVDDMTLRVLDARLGDGANDVGLVIFPRFVTNVDINNVVGVVQPEHRVGLIPVDVVKLLGFSNSGQAEAGDDEAQNLLFHLECGFLSNFVFKIVFIFSTN